MSAIATHLRKNGRDHLDRVLHFLSAYGIPVVIGLFSMVALFSWKLAYTTEGSQQIAFRVLEQQGDTLPLAAVLAAVAHQPDVLNRDTRLSEAPFWIAFAVAPDQSGSQTMIEFPSRHTLNMQCWDTRSGVSLGEASRTAVNGAFTAVKAGFALTLAAAAAERQILCNTTSTGPARISVVQWPIEELSMAARASARNSGLLEGGLIVLGMFVLVTAIINRDSTYLLFAAWLLVNLRMASLSSGWDMQWLGHTVPPEWMTQARALTLAIYYLLTVTLFRTLLREELNRVGYGRLLSLTQLICVPLLLASLLLSYRGFLPVLWISTSFSTVVLIFLSTRILIMTRSPVAIWYSASISITLFASLYEVISAAMGFKGLIDSVNSVTAALSSSLLAALAIAAHLRIKHQQLQDAQEKLRHTYDAMPIGIFTLDLEGRFMSANPAMCAMVDVKNIQFGKDTWSRFFLQEAWPRLHRMALVQTEVELEIPYDSPPTEKTAYDGTGEAKRFLVKATLARDKIEGSLQDISARFKATEELRFMANNDPLTKVLNRRGIDTVLAQAIKDIGPGAPLSLAYFDLDRFKLINDLYGHAAGDDVLIQVCERIASMLTGMQQIGRVGGDEFVIVFPDTTITAATWVCNGIVDCISTTPYPIGDKAFQVRGSIGLIDVIAGTKIKDAVSTADRACREAKSLSTNLIVYESYAEAFLEREAELGLVERFSSATAPEGLFLEMQPIMSLKNPHASLNFEVLLRMRDADGSIIPAGRLIPAAERSGRIGIIDRWVLTTTLAWLNANGEQLINTQFVCMNLSGASLNDEHFVKDAYDILEKNLRAASLLCLEITESVALHDLGNTRRFIDKVRSYGVKIALDDFGAGYTSFSYLKDLPADVLKIDGNFIRNMNDHPSNIAIVETIVILASNLGMRTVAEWAEDNATVQTLVDIGVDYVQGYAVARPQHPINILAAASAASFIQNPELIAFAQSLSDGANNPAGMPVALGLIPSFTRTQAA